MYHLAVGDPNSISLGGRCTPEARKRREPSDGAMGNAPLPAGVLEPGSGIVFTVHGTCRGKLQMGLRCRGDFHSGNGVKQKVWRNNR